MRFCTGAQIDGREVGGVLLSHHTDEERLMESENSVATLPHNQSR
jgi:hypothetical protein